MIAPLVFFAEGRRPGASFLFVWLYSTLMALVLVRWLLHALVVEYEVSATAAWIFALLLVASYSILPAAAAACYTALRSRTTPTMAPLLFAVLWMLAEWLRAEPLALPWLLAAHPLASAPVAIQTAALGGVYAVGFAVALVGAGVGLALASHTARPLLAPSAVLAATLFYGAWQLAASGTAQGETTLAVGIVQAAVPQSERFTPGSASRNTRRHAALSRELARGGPLDLVVWSETAVDEDLASAPELMKALVELTDATGAALVTGAPHSVAGRPSNSVLFFQPGEGLVESYQKQRLVPFSEYDPPLLRFLAPLLGPVTEGPAYAPGLKATVFRSAAIPFATPICFEITYPSLIRRFDRGGARLLLNLSNDAWFGRGGYAEMHLAHAIFRAVEGRIWVVRSTNSGISAVIDPRGRVIERLPLFREGTLRAEVGAREEPLPLYARFGNPPVLGLLLLIGALALAPREPRAGEPRSKRDPAPG